MSLVLPLPPTTSLLPDEEIVARVQRGEIALYEILMRRYNQRLYRVARSILRDEHEAEDVMQDAYVRAYEHLHQFAGQAAFATWLTRIAVHEALGRLRRRRRWTHLDATTPEEETVRKPGSRSADNPERDAYGQELRAVLESSIASLPATYRAVFVLRVVEGMAGADVAECLGISLDAEKMRLHRAKALLRRSLAERIGAACQDAYSFHLTACDRVVAGVMPRLATPSVDH